MALSGIRHYAYDIKRCLMYSKVYKVLDLKFFCNKKGDILVGDMMLSGTRCNKYYVDSCVVLDWCNPVETLAVL